MVPSGDIFIRHRLSSVLILYPLPYIPENVVMSADGILKINFSDKGRMETADVVRIFPIEFDNYFKAFHCRFRVQCPNYRCQKINKHGKEWKACPSVVELNEFRACEWCGREYRVEYSSARENLMR